MPKFSDTSKKRLWTAHTDLQAIFNEVIKYRDCSVIYGHRSVYKQSLLYKKGRELRNGKWVVVGATVTNLDGLKKKSKHNYEPSLAVDVMPYPIDWSDIDGIAEFGSFVKDTIKKLQDKYIIRHEIVWGANVKYGGNWKTMNDMAHWQLGKKIKPKLELAEIVVNKPEIKTEKKKLKKIDVKQIIFEYDTDEKVSKWEIIKWVLSNSWSLVKLLYYFIRLIDLGKKLFGKK